MVWDFPNIFMDELFSLPPKREMEFVIDLILRIHPISLPPYKMTLAELKELKTQLQDLVDNGFVWPSVSS